MWRSRLGVNSTTAPNTLHRIGCQQLLLPGVGVEPDPRGGIGIRPGRLDRSITHSTASRFLLDSSDHRFPDRQQDLRSWSDRHTLPARVESFQFDHLIAAVAGDPQQCFTAAGSMDGSLIFQYRDGNSLWRSGMTTADHCQPTPHQPRSPAPTTVVFPCPCRGRKQVPLARPSVAGIQIGSPWSSVAPQHPQELTRKDPT